MSVSGNRTHEVRRAALDHTPIDLHCAPYRSLSASEHQVDGQLVVASERGLRPLVLDPLAAVVWRSLDGHVTIGELSGDLQAVLGGGLVERFEMVSQLITAWAQQGCVDWHGCEMGPVPRRLVPRLTASSCIGQTVGIGGGTQLQVRVPGGSAFRVGSTISALLDGVRSSMVTEEVDDRELEMLFLRASCSSGHRPRCQYLFDQMGNRLHSTWSLEDAKSTLENSAHARLHQTEGVWIEGLTLEGPDGAVLVHPALRELTIDALREISLQEGPVFAPSVQFRLNNTTELEIVGPNSRRLPVRGVVGPPVDGPLETYTQVLHLARHWDAPHLEAIGDLVRDVGYRAVPTNSTLPDLQATLLGLARGRGLLEPETH